MSCYAAAERGERECSIRAECVWGCALWDHWAERRRKAERVMGRSNDRSHPEYGYGVAGQDGGNDPAHGAKSVSGHQQIWNEQGDQPTPGQQAARAIREAKVVLADPSKAEYHERLSAAVDRLQGELDFWAKLKAVLELVDVANEREEP